MQLDVEVRERLLAMFSTPGWASLCTLLKAGMKQDSSFLESNLITDSVSIAKSNQAIGRIQATKTLLDLKEKVVKGVL